MQEMYEKDINISGMDALKVQHDFMLWNFAEIYTFVDLVWWIITDCAMHT